MGFRCIGRLNGSLVCAAITEDCKINIVAAASVASLYERRNPLRAARCYRFVSTKQLSFVAVSSSRLPWLARLAVYPIDNKNGLC